MIRSTLIIMGLIGFVLMPPPQIVRNPDEPAPYPKGVYCTPKGDLVHGVQTDLHPCKCHNMVRESKDGCCDVPVTNDPVCAQFCNEAACACKKECIPGRPDETRPPSAPSEPIGPNQ